jgi:hypothetical protein
MLIAKKLSNSVARIQKYRSLYSWYYYYYLLPPRYYGPLCFNEITTKASHWILS